MCCVIVESNAFTEDFRTSPVEPGDKIIHRNFGKGFVIATFGLKAWLFYNDGRDRVHKIDILVNSEIVKVVH